MKKWLLTIGVVCSFANLQAQKWIPTAETPMPSPVSNNAVVGAQVAGVDYVYSFAGIGTDKTHDAIIADAWRYNTATMTWESISPLPDDPKVAASASVVKNKVYIIGGYHVAANGSEISSDKVHRYDPETNSYLSDEAAIPVPIDDQVQCVWKDSLIYVITGWSQNTNVQDVQIYNPTLDSWAEGTSLPTNHTFRSFGSSGVILNDTIYYFGGARIAANFPIQANLRKGAINPENPTEIEWTQEVLNSDIVGYRMAATTYGEKIYWIGGSGVTYNFDGIAYDGSGGVNPLNRNLVYDPATGKLTEDFSHSYPMDLRGLADISNHKKYLVGGMLVDQEVSDACLRLDFQSTLSVATEEKERLFVAQGAESYFAHSEAKINWFYYNLQGQLLAQGSSNGGRWNPTTNRNQFGILYVEHKQQWYAYKINPIVK